MTRAVTLGSTRVIASERLVGRRVGLVCNPASVDAQLEHVADRIAAAPGVTLAALFGPQHGFDSTAQDNMVETPHTRHPRYGVPVHSLYSDTREPRAAMLDGLDVLVIDLQDVGTRVYTYAYTMANCLRAAQRCGLQVIVCDRPNPIGGVALEGPVLDPQFASFVGQFPIPLRHGMTIGELAQLFNSAFGIGADLEVVAMDGWQRALYHDETDLPWIMPSPNLPTLDSAIAYPGTVLLEGTMLSEGRGTTRPFELVGAPWIDGDRLAHTLTALALPGAAFRPVRFEPTFQKHAGVACGGCQIHVLDRTRFAPVLTAVAVLQACREQAPDRFAWRPAPYEYEQIRLPIDILAGTDALRTQIEAERPARTIAATWTADLAAFEPLRAAHLLYD